MGMRRSLPIAITALLALAGTADGWFGYSQSALVWVYLQLELAAQDRSEGPEDLRLQREIRRTLERLYRLNQEGPPARWLLLIDRATDFVRSEFPEDESLEGLLADVVVTTTSTVMEDRDSFTSTVDLLEDIPTKDAVLRWLEIADRRLDAASNDEARTGWHLYRALRAIRSAEFEVNGGQEPFCRVRISGHGIYEAEKVFVGLSPMGGAHVGLFTTVESRDGRLADASWRSHQEVNVYWLPFRRTGTFDLEGDNGGIRFARYRGDLSDAGEGEKLYFTGDSPATLTLRTWMPSVGVVEGAFSGRALLGRATGSFESAAEEVWIEGEFRCTEVRL